jgi:hypothetical protein
MRARIPRTVKTLTIALTAVLSISLSLDHQCPCSTYVPQILS